MVSPSKEALSVVRCWIANSSLFQVIWYRNESFVNSTKTWETSLYYWQPTTDNWHPRSKPPGNQPSQCGLGIRYLNLQLVVLHRIAEIVTGDGHSSAVETYIVGLFGEFLYLVEVATTGKNTYMTRMIPTTHLLAHHITSSRFIPWPFQRLEIPQEFRTKNHPCQIDWQAYMESHHCQD